MGKGDGDASGAEKKRPGRKGRGEYAEGGWKHHRGFPGVPVAGSTYYPRRGFLDQVSSPRKSKTDASLAPVRVRAESPAYERCSRRCRRYGGI